MEYSINILEQVILDIDEATEWYESKDPELAQKFKKTLDERILLIQSNPKMFIEIEDTQRRAILGSSFPFNIYYSIDETTKVIKIGGVVHQHRDIELVREELNLDYSLRIKKEKKRKKDIEKERKLELLRKSKEQGRSKGRDIER